MIFFSGFGFENESSLFSEFLEDANYNLAGFSYGAQKAIDFALASQNRINKIFLFSPAFFNNKDSNFRHSQIESFKKNQKFYMNFFLKNAGFRKEWAKFLATPKLSDLESLLNYEFKKENLKTLTNKGIKIIVYLGDKDKIVDSSIAAEFFRKFGIVYFLKNKNHFLKES
ncbi:MAG: pimelyl-ACP methyl ester esterase BioV [Helicobacteraceae bacterium]|nr:pimelyl-ACP methyl ester esterase BioV [Helicobacteraceae bacterium]